MVDSVLSTGLRGVQTGISTTQDAANSIVRATTTEESDSGESLTEAIVDLKRGEQQVQASAAVIRTADDILGTLLDTKA